MMTKQEFEKQLQEVEDKSFIELFNLFIKIGVDKKRRVTFYEDDIVIGDRSTGYIWHGHIEKRIDLIDLIKAMMSD